MTAGEAFAVRNGARVERSVVFDTGITRDLWARSGFRTGGQENPARNQIADIGNRKYVYHAEFGYALSHGAFG